MTRVLSSPLLSLSVAGFGADPRLSLLDLIEQSIQDYGRNTLIEKMRTQSRRSFIQLAMLCAFIVAAIGADERSEIISRFQNYLRINTAHPSPDYYAAAEFIIAEAKSISLESRTIEFVAGKPLKRSGFEPVRDVYLSFVPDEEIGGHDGAEKLAHSDVFKEMNVGIVLDEGLASPDENYRVFYAERSPMWTVIKATGAPGHGAKLYDNTAMENLLKSIESVRKFRESQFDMVKAGLKAEGEVVPVNMVFLKAGTPSPTVSSIYFHHVGLI